MLTKVETRALFERCRSTGTVRHIAKALTPSLTDDELQSLSDLLPLRIRRPHPKTNGQNEVRANLVEAYSRAKTCAGWDEAAFLVAYGQHRRLPDGSFIRETRARDIIAKPPGAVRKILQQRNSLKMRHDRPHF